MWKNRHHLCSWLCLDSPRPRGKKTVYILISSNIFIVLSYYNFCVAFLHFISFLFSHISISHFWTVLLDPMTSLCSDDLPWHRPHRVHMSTAFVPHLSYTNQLLSVPLIALDPVVAITVRSVGISCHLPSVRIHRVGCCKHICVISVGNSSCTPLEKEVRDCGMTVC